VTSPESEEQTLPLINADQERTKPFETRRKGGSGGNSEDQGIGRSKSRGRKRVGRQMSSLHRNKKTVETEAG
jgi:hypothetical protein